jgi:hypothetical protein
VQRAMQEAEHDDLSERRTKPDYEARCNDTDSNCGGRTFDS